MYKNILEHLRGWVGGLNPPHGLKFTSNFLFPNLTTAGLAVGQKFCC